MNKKMPDDTELDARQEAAGDVLEVVTWWATGRIDHEELAGDVRQLAQQAEQREHAQANTDNGITAPDGSTWSEQDQLADHELKKWRNSDNGDTVTIRTVSRDTYGGVDVELEIDFPDTTIYGYTDVDSAADMCRDWMEKYPTTDGQRDGPL